MPQRSNSFQRLILLIEASLAPLTRIMLRRILGLGLGAG
jgi:hypothetical protein